MACQGLKITKFETEKLVFFLVNPATFYRESHNTWSVFVDDISK